MKKTDKKKSWITNYCITSEGSCYCNAGYELMTECDFYERSDNNKDVCKYFIIDTHGYCTNKKAQKHAERKEK